MEKRKRKLAIILIFILLILIVYFLFHSSQEFYFQEDFLFFKFLGNHFSKENKKQNQYLLDNKIADTNHTYFFRVNYGNSNVKTIDLGKTIDSKTLIKDKVAPGTEGFFDMVLLAEESCEYEVTFQSKNEKPKNLSFFLTENQKYNSLEELQKELKGELKKEEPKKITVFWKWKYEENEVQDERDTKDGKTLKNYHFNLLVEVY